MDSFSIPSIIEQLLYNPYSKRPVAEHSMILRTGIPKPIFGLTPTDQLRVLIKYARNEWLGACPHLARFFCWPCLLYTSAVTVEGRTEESMVDIENLLFHRDSGRHRVAQEMWFAECRALSVERLPGSGGDHQVALTSPTQGRKRSYYEMSPDLRAQPPRNPSESEFFYFRQLLNALYHRINSPNITDSIQPSPYVSQYERHPSSTWLTDKLLHLAIVRDKEMAHLPMMINQNQLYRDLFAAAVGVIKSEIRAEVGTASYVSVLFEDLSLEPLECHLAVTLRFVTQDGALLERFVGFRNVRREERNAEDFLTILARTVDNFDLSSRLVGFALDGYAIANDEFTKLAAKIREIYGSKVIITDAYRLERFLAARLQHTSQPVSVFFERLTSLTHQLVQLHFGERISDALHSFGYRSGAKKILPLNRVASGIDAARAMLVNFFRSYKIIMPNLREQTREDYHREIRIARADLHFLTDFSCILMTPFMVELMVQSTALESTLRRHAHNWCACRAAIDKHYSSLVRFKEENFDRIWLESLGKLRTALAGQSFQDDPHLSEVIQENCTTEAKDFFGLGLVINDVNSGGNQEEVKAKLSSWVDAIFESAKSLAEEFRFGSMQKLTFMALIANKAAMFRKNFPEESLMMLGTTFPGHFDLEALRIELQCLYEQEDLAEWKRPDKLLEWLLRSPYLVDRFPQTVRLLRLCLTIPCQWISDSVTPKASCRGRISKEYHTSEHRHVRLHNEGFLYIEKDLFLQLIQTGLTFHQRVWDQFNRLRSANQAMPNTGPVN